MEQKSERTCPTRTISLFDAVCIIVGTIIGAGIFQTAPMIASFSGSFQAMIGLWIIGGLVTVIGSLCFAELTTRFSDVAGGDYGFLKLAYGKPMGFLFAWATFWIIRPGNIGAMALTFATYFDKVLGFAPEDSQLRVGLYTVAAVLLLSAANLIGLRQGKWIQNILTVAKVAGIGVIILIALVAPSDTSGLTTSLQDSGDSSAMWLLALVFIMFSFGGWNDISFIATEIKSPERNLLRSLLFGSILVTAIYLVLNLAFVYALGFQSVSQSSAVATDVVENCLGSENWIGNKSSQVIAALISISCLGAINGIIITSPRIYYAAGKDYPLIRVLGRWDFKRNQPWIATAFQAIVTIGFCLLCFQYKNPFQVILVASAPFFWAFLGLAGVSVIVFRMRYKATENQSCYRVPLYPLEPILLSFACFAMTYSSLKHMLTEGYWVACMTVVLTMAFGIVLAFLVKPIDASPTVESGPYPE